LVNDQGSVKWMCHVAMPHDEIPFDAPVLSIDRHFVEPAQKSAFEQAFNANKDYFASCTAPRKMSGGWRIEKEYEFREEWVLFIGWDEVWQHYAFPQSEKFQEGQENPGSHVCS